MKPYCLSILILFVIPECIRDGEELTAVKGFFTSKQQNNNYFLMGEKYGKESLENWIFSGSKYSL